MSAIRLIFEALPVVLAIVAIFACGHKAITTRRTHDRNVYLGMIVCAALLITAQSSWTFTMLQGMTQGTMIADMIWTAFNACVMLVFILSTRRDK